MLLGDELDSPRGRIYLIKDMLENDKPATAGDVKHIDRCLSCLSCMTTCPSGVHYMHLVDHGRAHIEETYRRPWSETPDAHDCWRRCLPRPGCFAWRCCRGDGGAAAGRLLPAQAAAHARSGAGAIRRRPAAVDQPQVFPPQGTRRKRVALLNGCAQQVLAPQINEADDPAADPTRRRGGGAKGQGCCGALTHHMGREHRPRLCPRQHRLAWTRRSRSGGLDAIVINASGCGTTVKDYGFMFREDQDYAEKAARISALAKDVTEFMAELGLGEPVVETRPVVAYHSACSMQHGQKIIDSADAPAGRAGFRSAMCRRPICAAVRPEPTICSSRRSPGSCATARSPTSRAVARR